MRHDSARETLQIRVTVKGRHISAIYLHTSTLTELSRDENLTNPTNRPALGQLWS